MITPVEGTRIIYEQNGAWFSKFHNGSVVSCFTDEYALIYKELYSAVIVDEPKDDEYLSKLNGDGDFFTIITDKHKVGKPDLLSFEHTIEWIPLSQWKGIAQKTKYFCNMAVTHYNPYLINKMKENGSVPLTLQGVI